MLLIRGRSSFVVVLVDSGVGVLSVADAEVLSVADAEVLAVADAEVLAVADAEVLAGTTSLMGRVSGAVQKPVRREM